MLSSLELIKRDMRTELSKTIPTISPINIIRVAKKIESKYGSIEIDLANRDIKDLFFTAKEAYTKKNDAIIFSKDVRYLPYILDLTVKNEEIIVQNKEFTLFILDIICKRKRINSALGRLVKTYLNLYGNNAQGVEVLRQCILTNLCTTSSRRKSVLKYKENIFLFERDAALLAVNRLNSKTDIKEFLISIGISDEMLSSGFVEAFSYVYFKSSSVAMKQKLDNLHSLLERPDGSINTKLMKGVYASADVLIPFANTFGIDFRTEIRQFYMKHLRDPRLPGTKRWDNVSPEACKIFKQWITKFDLDVFFELIETSASDRAWRYRKKFWEVYIPHMDSTWVVLGSKARSLVMSMRKGNQEEYERFNSYGELRGASSEQSVFIFEMRGYIFIEWSHSGRLRIWKKSASPISIGAKSYFADDLRSDALYSKVHAAPDAYAWQEDVKLWIVRNCGIAPKDSFRL